MHIPNWHILHIDDTPPPAHTDRNVLVLPATWFSSFTLTLPPHLSPDDASHAALCALEEQLAQPIEELVLWLQDSPPHTVAYVTALSQLRDALAPWLRVPLTHLLPAPLLLASPPEGTLLVCVPDHPHLHPMIKQADGRGGYLDTQQPAHWQAFCSQLQPQAVVVQQAHPDQPHAIYDWLKRHWPQDIAQPTWTHTVLQWCLPEHPVITPWKALHVPAPRTPRRTIPWPRHAWRYGMACVLGLWLAGSARLHHSTQRIQARTQEVLTTLGASTVADAQAQLRTRVALYDQTMTWHHQWALIAKRLMHSPNTVLQAVQWTPDGCVITVLNPDPADWEQAGAQWPDGTIIEQHTTAQGLITQWRWSHPTEESTR